MNESVEWEKLTQFQHPRKEKDYSKDRHEIMCKDKQVIEAEEVGSLEEVLGEDDPLFQPEPESKDK